MEIVTTRSAVASTGIWERHMKKKRGDLQKEIAAAAGKPCTQNGSNPSTLVILEFTFSKNLTGGPKLVSAKTLLSTLMNWYIYWTPKYKNIITKLLSFR